MYLWRNVWLLSAMVATGYCLQCTTCPGIGVDSCIVSSTESCPQGNVCASRQQMTIAAEIVFQSFEKFCAPPNECNVTGTFTTPYSKERVATRCCSEDLCMPEKPKVPDQSVEPNGLVCPRCALGSDSCEDLDTMDCTGEETMCRLVTKKQTIGSLTLTTINRGCASEGFCFTSNEISTRGQCLQCYTCSNINSDTCLFLLSAISSCPAGNVCASRYSISSNILIFQKFYRFCAQPSECNATGIFSTSFHSSERMATTCCSENLCTPEKPIAPDGSSTPNGLKCPEWNLNCAGDQTMCLVKTGKQSTGSETVTSIEGGCASEGFCYQRNESSTAGTVLSETTYTCTRATNDVSSTTKSTAKTILSSVLPFIMVLVPFNACIF
ncbi:uncharacterized protein [Phyllobates terribilis]|uniref:uncharacterized protein n=1 Tax=Phyllobates terribilis TaxID=111132 RepID=UPI003CCAD241